MSSGQPEHKKYCYNAAPQGGVFQIQKRKQHKLQSQHKSECSDNLVSSDIPVVRLHPLVFDNV